MKKIAISMILIMILCYGCSNGNSESDMTVGWQIIEEVQQSDVMQHEIVEEQEMEYKPVSAESSEKMQGKEGYFIEKLNKCENGFLIKKSILLELDRRYGSAEGKEEYYIFLMILRKKRKKSFGMVLRE